MPDNQVSQTLNNARQIVEQNIDTIYGINTLGSDFVLTDILDKVARQLQHDEQLDHDELAEIERITSRTRRRIREQYGRQRRISQLQAMCLSRTGHNNIGELIGWIQTNDYHFQFDASIATDSEDWWRNCVQWLDSNSEVQLNNRLQRVLVKMQEDEEYARIVRSCADFFQRSSESETDVIERAVNWLNEHSHRINGTFLFTVTSHWRQFYNYLARHNPSQHYNSIYQDVVNGRNENNLYRISVDRVCRHFHGYDALSNAINWIQGNQHDIFGRDMDFSARQDWDAVLQYIRQLNYETEVNSQETENQETETRQVTRPREACPRYMRDIKRACYAMLNVRDTQHMKRRLQYLGLGRILDRVSLKNKAGWHAVFQFLQDRGYRTDGNHTNPGTGSNTESDHHEASAVNEASNVVNTDIPQVDWRPCGIEIECAPPRGFSSHEMRVVIRDNLRSMREAGEISRGWSSELDCSCGNEVVSPILYSREQFRREVMAIRARLKDLGMRAVRSAGGHVHINTEGYAPVDYLKISRRYTEIFNDVLRPQLMQYRIDNRYCRVTRNHSLDEESIGNRSWNTVCEHIQAGNRFRAVNGATGKSTIEYRQGACILYRAMDENAIMQWVDTLQALHQHQL